MGVSPSVAIRVSACNEGHTVNPYLVCGSLLSADRPLCADGDADLQAAPAEWVTWEEPEPHGCAPAALKRCDTATGHRGTPSLLTDTVPSYVRKNKGELRTLCS